MASYNIGDIAILKDSSNKKEYWVRVFEIVGFSDDDKFIGKVLALHNSKRFRIGDLIYPNIRTIERDFNISSGDMAKILYGKI